MCSDEIRAASMTSTAGNVQPCAQRNTSCTQETPHNQKQNKKSQHPILTPEYVYNRLEDLCICPICLEGFCYSVTLACGHTFDRDCILHFGLSRSSGKNPSTSAVSTASSNSDSSQKYFKCPLCRRVGSCSDLGSLERNHILDQVSYLLSPESYHEKQQRILTSSQVHQLLTSHGMFVQDLVPVVSSSSSRHWNNDHHHPQQRVLLLASEEQELMRHLPGIGFAAGIALFIVLALIVHGLFDLVVQLEEEELMQPLGNLLQVLSWL